MRYHVVPDFLDDIICNLIAECVTKGSPQTTAQIVLSDAINEAKAITEYIMKNYKGVEVRYNISFTQGFKFERVLDIKVLLKAVDSTMVKEVMEVII